MSTMDVDPVTGVVWISYYDQGRHRGNQTDVSVVFSVDGGNKFAPFRITETPFTPDTSVFFGDYMGIIAFDNIVRPVWTRLDDQFLSVWTAIVDKGLIDEFTGTWVDEFELDATPHPAYPTGYCQLQRWKGS